MKSVDEEADGPVQCVKTGSASPKAQALNFNCVEQLSSNMHNLLLVPFANKICCLQSSFTMWILTSNAQMFEHESVYQGFLTDDILELFQKEWYSNEGGNKSILQVLT